MTLLQATLADYQPLSNWQKACARYPLAQWLSYNRQYAAGFNLRFTTISVHFNKRYSIFGQIQHSPILTPYRYTTDIINRAINPIINVYLA